MEPQTPKRDGHLDYLLTAYVFDSLSAAGRKEVQEHLGQCAACRAQLSLLIQTLGMAEQALDSGGKEYVFEERRRQRVLEAARQRSTMPTIQWSWKLSAVAALLMVTVLVGFVMTTAHKEASKSTVAAAQCKAFAEAPENYHRTDYNADGVLEYAEKMPAGAIEEKAKSYNRYVAPAKEAPAETTTSTITVAPSTPPPPPVAKPAPEPMPEAKAEPAPLPVPTGALETPIKSRVSAATDVPLADKSDRRIKLESELSDASLIAPDLKPATKQPEITFRDVGESRVIAGAITNGTTTGGAIPDDYWKNSPHHRNGPAPTTPAQQPPAGGYGFGLQPKTPPALTPKTMAPASSGKIAKEKLAGADAPKFFNNPPDTISGVEVTNPVTDPGKVAGSPAKDAFISSFDGDLDTATVQGNGRERAKEITDLKLKYNEARDRDLHELQKSTELSTRKGHIVRGKLDDDGDGEVSNHEEALLGRKEVAIATKDDTIRKQEEVIRKEREENAQLQVENGKLADQTQREVAEKKIQVARERAAGLAVEQRMSEKEFADKKKWIEEQYKEKTTLNRELADRQKAPQGNYTIWADDWSKELEKAGEKKTAPKSVSSVNKGALSAEPDSREVADIVVPAEILSKAELGDHFETINPDRPDTKSAFGNPDAPMFHGRATGLALEGEKKQALDDEIKKLQGDVDKLQKKLGATSPAMRSTVDKEVDSKYGPNAGKTREYVSDKDMSLGYALTPAPVAKETSGRDDFMISNSGTIYQSAGGGGVGGKDPNDLIGVGGIASPGAGEGWGGRAKRARGKEDKEGERAWYWNNVTARQGELRGDGTYLTQPGVSGNNAALKYLLKSQGEKSVADLNEWKVAGDGPIRGFAWPEGYDPLAETAGSATIGPRGHVAPKLDPNFPNRGNATFGANNLNFDNGKRGDQSSTGFAIDPLGVTSLINSNSLGVGFNGSPNTTDGLNHNADGTIAYIAPLQASDKISYDTFKPDGDAGKTYMKEMVTAPDGNGNSVRKWTGNAYQVDTVSGKEQWAQVVPAISASGNDGGFFYRPDEKLDATKAPRPYGNMSYAAVPSLQSGKNSVNLNQAELMLRGYRHLRADNPELSWGEYLRRPASVPAVAHTDEGLDEDAYIEKYGTRPFVDCARDHLSTFGMDVDTASYTLARQRLNQNQLPDPEGVRVEEFLNYFKQPYSVAGEDAFGVFVEGMPNPFAPCSVSPLSLPSPSRGEGKQRITAAEVHDTELLKIGIKSREARPDERKPAMLTFVVDTSGSMTQQDRLELVRAALKALVAQLHPEDALSIIGFNDQAEMVLARTQAKQKQRILDAIDALSPHGATNVEAGLAMAYRVADESYTPEAVNRVILCSDGVANVGAKGPDEILKMVKVFAARGIDLCTIGFGMGKYNDQMMVKLADNGNGSSHFVDSRAEAEKIFREQLPPHLNVLARDAKVQVDFNADVIERYRLLGYEKRKIADKDFRNDKIDAGEVAHNTLVTVLYEIQRKPAAHGALGKVYLRWKDAAYRHLPVVERNYPMSEGVLAADAQRSAPELRFLACVARFAELLRGSKWTQDSSYAAVLEQLAQLPPEFQARPDFSEVRDLVSKAQMLSVKQWAQEIKK